MAKDRIKNYAQGTSEINILKDIRTDLSVTPSSYTPDTSTVTRDRLVTFAQAEEELVVLGDIEEGVKQQVVKGDIADKRISNIEKLLQGNLYDYDTDDDTAYIKSVPAGAMPYAGLEKVGGKTIVWNQLCQNGDFASASGWVQSDASTMSLGVADNIATITVTSALRSEFSSLQRTVTSVMKTGHKIYACADVMPTATGGATSIGITYSTPTYNNTQAIGGGWYHYEALLSIQDSTSHRLEIYLTRVTTDDYASVAVGETMKVKNVKIFDLTQMFGAGNEPSTVAEFESMFPASYYPYNAGTLLSAGVTEVVSKDSDNATLQTISIPTAIRNLEGYGWSAGTASNYIDFERKKFVKCVDRVNMGSFTWTYNSDEQRFVTQELSGMGYKEFSPSEVANCVCEKYVTVSRNNITDYDKDISLSYNVLMFINVRDSAYTDAPTFTTAMTGVYLYYELDTPVEVDISAYLTDDNLIEVEAGGTLTFPNQNGDDYRLPVPSEETYMIDLQEAINNG